MTINLGTDSGTFTMVERTWRVEMFTDVGTDYVLKAHREKLWLKDDGSIFRRELLLPVEVSLSQISDATFTAGDLKVTGAQMAALVSAAADTLSQARDKG